MSTPRHSPAAMMAAQAVCLIHLHTKDRKTVSQVAGTIESFYPAPASDAGKTEPPSMSATLFEEMASKQ